MIRGRLVASFGSLVLLTLLTTILAPSPASATVLAQGRLRVLAGPPPYEQIDRTESTGTENSDSGSVSTISGATNSADYDISLDRGWLQANISGDNGEAASCNTYCPGSYNGLVHLDLYEGIHFTLDTFAWRPCLPSLRRPRARLGLPARRRPQRAEAFN